MRKLYGIYLINFEKEKLYFNHDVPLTYEFWSSMLFSSYDIGENRKMLYQDLCVGFIEVFLQVPRPRLIDMAFNPNQDGGGVRFRSEVLLNDNNLIEMTNKVLRFMQ